MLAPFPHNGQPRMGMFYNLRAILTILVAFGVVSPSILDELACTRSWLQAETEKWVKEVTTVHNYAKQLALIAVGKTAEFIGSDLPVVHRQDDAEVAHRHAVAVDRVGRYRACFVRRQVGDDLMSIEIEVDPL